MLPKLSTLLSALPFATASLTYRGVDWSSVPVEEAGGLTYKPLSGSSSTTTTMESILSSSGVNIVRQRLWVNPSDGNYNLAYNMALAKRAAAANMSLYLDLHFSDTWADPGNQVIPSGWPEAIDDLAWTVYNYTKEVANEFKANGVTPEIISIGNEITNGMLFPTGKLSSEPYNLARLLHSASSGIRDSNVGTTSKIAIHLDNGWNKDTQLSWYKTVLDEGALTTADFDMIGVSYYPFYNSEATLTNLKSSLEALASTYAKDLIVAETDWPTYCSNPKYAFPADTKDIPISVAGQSMWIKDVAEIVGGVKNGKGLFYWEPAWVSNAGLGSSCEYNCMFADDGTAMESMEVFKHI